MPQDLTVAVKDESIFIHDVLIRRKMWTPKGLPPTVTITDSHQKTRVFGTFSMDGRQLFRQYPVFSQDTFLSYLKEILGKFGRLILFIDRAVQHYHSVKVRQYLQDNSDRIKVEYLPKGSPEFNAVEECWRQVKDHLLVSRYYPKFEHLKDAIGMYYRTRRSTKKLVLSRLH